MTVRRDLPSRAASIVVYGMCLAAIFSCSREPVAAPPMRADAASAVEGKSPAALAVTAVSPPFGDRGVTIDVHVFGSGFTAGAQATWLLHGAADPAHVHTNSTTFISSTEVVANVTIASDATLDFWDVQIALAGGKNGVGSELFEVTTAQILGPGTPGGLNPVVYAMSQSLQIAGWVTGGGTSFVYDDVAGMVNLGTGQAWAIDPLGTIIGGRDDNLIAAAWVQQSPSTWKREQLPRLPFSVGGNVMGAARTSDGTLLVSGFDDSAASAKPNAPGFNRPVVWQRIGNSWSAPLRYTLPAGSLKGAAHTINGLGQVAGRVDGGPTGAVWENPTTSTRLDGTPSAINAAGTLIVGEKTISTSSTGVQVTIPVYWWRNQSTGVWDGTGKPLPSLAGASCTTGTVQGLNSGGILVGSSCNAAGKTQATVWRLDLSGPLPVLVVGPTGLSGLGTGPKNSQLDISDAISVSEASPYTVAGMALEGGITRLAVRWRLIVQ